MNSRTKKIILISSIVLIVIVAALLIYFYKIKDVGNADTDPLNRSERKELMRILEEQGEPQPLSEENLSELQDFLNSNEPNENLESDLEDFLNKQQ